MEKEISEIVEKFVKATFKVSVKNFEFQSTRKDFEGDITLVLFPLVKQIKINPKQLGELIGSELKSESDLIKDFNVVNGFLNLTITSSFYILFLDKVKNDLKYGHTEPKDDANLIMVEYSSPNTNKPLHLGHIRNNLLGYSISQILKANGNKIIKTQIINDRGIHICKSMVAWKLFGENKSPLDAGIKGDHFVGKFYVLFNKEYNIQVKTLVEEGQTEEYAKANASIFMEAQDLLIKWEANDKEVRELWNKMNDWVYNGFEDTYKMLGVDFDSYYYESDTYLLGKKLIKEGISKGVFYSKTDGSVWVDLKSDGLDEKLLLRSDGTSVYMTQDLGTAYQRFLDHSKIDGMVYTVGNEQDYHFKVLFLILKKLGYNWSKNLFHLSYGMVDLPTGKMKSREGTVVDADDLITTMRNSANQISEEHGRIQDVEDPQKLFLQIGLGALKYFILKVDTKKRILFDPKASFDFNGNTGPFIQYAYARIQSILRSANKIEWNSDIKMKIDNKEKEILKQLLIYPGIVKQAGESYSPSLIANYLYDLVKVFNSFYQNISILGESDSNIKNFRLTLIQKVGHTILNSCSLLGIEVPERM
jgi:arginyl-tRNA synthetase